MNGIENMQATMMAVGMIIFRLFLAASLFVMASIDGRLVYWTAAALLMTVRSRSACSDRLEIREFACGEPEAVHPSDDVALRWGSPRTMRFVPHRILPRLLEALFMIG